jgi:hypothetical protein
MRGAVRIPRPERVPRGSSTPAGIVLGVGSGVAVASVIVAALVPSSAGDWRLAPVAAALFWLGTWMPGRVVIAVMVIADLLVDGFLVNRSGILTWDGLPDIYRVLMLTGAATIGLLVGALRPTRRRSPMWYVPLEWLPQRSEDPGPLTSAGPKSLSTQPKEERFRRG